MKKEKLVTLKEALPAMVRVFCSLANGSRNVHNYAVKNERCINHYIYFLAESFIYDKYAWHANDNLNSGMLEDIYRIVEKFLREKIPLNIYEDCIKIAKGTHESKFEEFLLGGDREEIVMSSVCYILETLDVRINDPYYSKFMADLRLSYGNTIIKGGFYDDLTLRLSIIKDEPCWCADEKELSRKTEFEINHEAWVEEFFGVSGSDRENSSENVLTEIEQTSLQLSLPPFKKSNVGLIWKERLMKFYGENDHILLNCSKYNHILRCLVWFMEEWDKQGLLIKQPNRAAIQFLVESCGFKCDGVSVKRIAGVLGALRKMTNELCEEKELVRTYMQNT
jgi:hypothetical protein